MSSKINYIVFIILSFTLLAVSLISKPQRNGDGHEYSLIAKSFVNHLSPNITANDVSDRINDIYENNSSDYSLPYLENIKKGILDNEENGFTLFQEMEEDEKNISAWDCIIDAVAYVSRAAYEKEGVKYLPEPIEIVDDNIFTHMVQSLILCDSMECEYIEKVYKKCLGEVK